MQSLTIVLIVALLSAFTPSAIGLRHDPTVVTIDTLMDVGGHRLHFHIWKGKTPAILFEAGGGDNLTVWNDLLAPIYKATGATLVTYDRAGSGKSEIDTNRITLNQQLTSLKMGLSKLNIDDTFVLVSHSFGGYFATLFAARYPAQVREAVLIDPNQVSFWTDAQTKGYWKQYEPMKETFRKENQVVYWLMVNALQNAQEMRQVSFPKAIPVIDILAQTPPWESEDERLRWRQAQERFVAASPKRKLILAIGSGHYIMRDKPQFVLDAVAKMYKNPSQAVKE